MLSVVPIKQSSVSSNYYLKQDGGYYIEDGKNAELYQWFGKGADDLGLNGAINNADHNNVYSGRLPNGDIVGKLMPDRSIKGRPGYDLTFSMNKDISLIICASNDKSLSDYFLKAHINAVKTALTEVEKRIEARITLNCETTFETTKNMIASLCTHFSSRAGDADVHTHALIANATKRSDGKWRALATDMSRINGFFEMIRDNAVYFGSIYQNEMACATKNAGFNIEPVHKNGMFKIIGFPDDLRDHFSKRRKQIEEIVSTLNPAVQQDKKIYDKVAQHSKASKETIDQQSFYEKSKRDIQSYLDINHNGKTFDDILQNCISKDITVNNNPFSKTESAAQAIHNAISSLSKFQLSFDKNKIAHLAISNHLGEITNQDIQAELNRLIASRELISTSNNDYTTQALIEREKILIQSVNNASKSDFEKTILSKYDGKFQTIFNKNRFCVITEPNRLQDKNTCLSELIASLESQDKKVKVLTLDKGINQDLNDKNKSSDNLFNRLKNIVKSDIAINVHAFIKQYEADVGNPLNNMLSQKGREVLIVDDAKRLDFDSVQKLIDLSNKRQSNIVFLKNHNGRHSIFSGNPLELIEKCNINKIDARQLYKDNQKTFSENDLSKKITITEPQGSDKPQGTSARQLMRQRTLAKLLASQNSNQIENSMAVSHSKKSTEQLNLIIRDELKNAGKIGQNQYVIKILKPVYLDDVSKAKAKSYPENALLKTYLGRGVFRTQKILGHDAAQNKVILHSEFGRRSLIDPNKIAKDMSRNIASIYEEKSIALSQGDKILLTHDNKMSRHLNLQSQQAYKIIEINDKQVILQHTATNKTLKTKLSNLSDLSLNYGYAISVHGSLSVLKNQTAHCDLPVYTINKNLLSDIGRYAEKINVVTDDTQIAKTRIDKLAYKRTIADCDIQSQQSISTHANTLKSKISHPTKEVDMLQ